MKVSIVTPTFNRDTYLDDTIFSILTQKGDFELEYIIQDGGSNSEFIERLEFWFKRYESGEFSGYCNSLTFKIYSEKDTGMYDALNKGFSKTTGEILCWLNSDDMLHPRALETVCQIFKSHSSIDWLTGIPNSYNEYGSRTGFEIFPNAYSRKLIDLGFYRHEFYNLGLNWIQQESTFWRRGLWEKAGPLNSKLKYSADFYLWQSFSKYTDLVRVESFLGGYRSHLDQITSNPSLYLEELPEKPHVSKRFIIFYLICKYIPKGNKLFFNKYRGKPFLKLLNLRFDDLKGRKVTWCWKSRSWKVWEHGIY